MLKLWATLFSHLILARNKKGDTSPNLVALLGMLDFCHQLFVVSDSWMAVLTAAANPMKHLRVYFTSYE